MARSKKPRIGRPAVAGTARENQIKVRATDAEVARYQAIADAHGCASIADAMRLAMDRLEKGGR